MAIVEPRRIAEIPGPKRAAAIFKQEGIDAIKRSKHPVMIVGHLAAEIGINDRKMIDYLIDLGKTRRIPIIATGDTNRALLQRGYTQATIMTAVDAGHRLSDREWKGLDGKGPYDLAVFAGLPDYMEWTILSGLIHFAPHVRAVSLKWSGRYYPGFSTLPRTSGPGSGMAGKSERSQRTAGG